MSRPVVSVLVPAFNHERYLGEAVESILAQDLTGPIEVLIGEDHSTDGTLEVAETYARAHPQTVRIITADRNVGMHENNARLLTASSGEFIAYCEADDLWATPSKLRTQVEHLSRHPEQTGVHSDVNHLIERGERRYLQASYWGHHRPGKSRTTTFDDLLVENVVQTCSVVLRGDLARSFVNSPLDTGRYAVADWPMFLHAAMSGPLGYLPETLATYRRVIGSATNKGALAAEARVQDQIRMLVDASTLHDHDPAKLEEGLRRTRWALVQTGVHVGDRQMVQRSVAQCRQAGDHSRRVQRADLLARVPGAVPVAGAYYRLRRSFSERRLYLEHSA